MASSPRSRRRAARSTRRSTSPSGWRRWRRTRSPAPRSCSSRPATARSSRSSRPSAITSSTTCSTPTAPRASRPSREARAALLLSARKAVTSGTAHASAGSYNRGTVQHRIGLVVLQTLPAAAQGDPVARDGAPAAPTARILGVARRRPRNGAACANGAVRVSSVSLSGKQVTLTYVEPGTWFGDIALFDGLPRTHDANAHGADHAAGGAQAPTSRELLSQHVELYDALLRLNCRRLRLMFDPIEDLNTRPLASRLAKQILLLARSYGVAAGRRDPHRPAARAGRPGAAARRLAPARQPGAEGLRARRRGARSSRRGWSCCRRTSCWRSPRASACSRALPAH